MESGLTRGGLRGRAIFTQQNGFESNQHAALTLFKRQRFAARDYSPCVSRYIKPFPGSDLCFRLCDVAGDGNCMFHAIAASPLCPFLEDERKRTRVVVEFVDNCLTAIYQPCDVVVIGILKRIL